MKKKYGEGRVWESILKITKSSYLRTTKALRGPLTEASDFYAEEMAFQEMKVTHTEVIYLL